MAPRTLTVAREPVPVGVFLQPTFTWSRLGQWGEVYLGVHPMLAELVGSPVEVDLRENGEYVEKGDPLVRFVRGDRHLTVRAPIAGRVERNHRPPSEATTTWLDTAGPEGAWLYRVVPRRLADELGAWLDGDAATAWTRRRYADVREYLQRALVDRHLGTMMAGGGELPAGVLGEMDQEVWAGLEAVLSTPETIPEES